MGNDVFIKLEERLAGIKFWAVHLPTKIEVYVYIGRNPDTGIYYFRRYKDKQRTMLMLSRYSIENKYIRPFCISTHMFIDEKEPA